jgi:hypothetical protein
MREDIDGRIIAERPTARVLANAIELVRRSKIPADLTEDTTGRTKVVVTPQR